MKEQSKILKKLYDFMVGILFFAVAVGGVLFLSVTLLSGFFNPFEVVLGLSGIILLSYISIIVHEAGHLVFGLMSGYGFSSFRIGSMMWVKQDGKIRLRRFSLAGTGGQCLMVPKGEAESKAQLIMFNLGGVFANVVFAALFALLYYLSLRVILLALIFLFGAILYCYNQRNSDRCWRYCKRRYERTSSVEKSRCCHSLSQPAFDERGTDKRCFT